MFLMLLKLVSYVEQECIYLMENTVNIYSDFFQKNNLTEP